MRALCLARRFRLTSGERMSVWVLAFVLMIAVFDLLT